MLRDCVVLAIEGTHASGKTTLTHALAACAAARRPPAHDDHRRQAIANVSKSLTVSGISWRRPTRLILPLSWLRPGTGSR
jgi:hypothetical protein